MKTLTEFAAPTLKNAARIHQELVAAGKTPEELPAAMGETLKLEGDKLALMLAAIELVGGKVADLKRVIVGALNEGEKAPSGATEKDGKQFVVEYYPSISAKSGKPERDGRRGRRGDRKKGRGGERGARPPRGGEQREDRGGRPRREPRPESAGPIPLPKPRPKPGAETPTAAETSAAQGAAEGGSGNAPT